MWNAKSSSRAAGLAALALLTASPSLTAQTASPDELTALREQIRLLDQKLKALERNIELKDETAAAVAKKQPSVSIGSRGLTITSPDKDYSLKVGALVQTDARVYLDDSGANRDHLRLRRIRLPITAKLGDSFTAYLQPDFASADTAGNNTQLVDAWGQIAFTPGLSLKFGKFFGPVALETPNNRHFIESSYTNQLAPNRDIGVEAAGSLADDFVTYRLGVYNGAPNNTWAGTVNGGDGDFTLGGRLAVSPFKNADGALAPLSFSVGGTVGHYAGNTSAIRTNGQQTAVAAYAIDGRQVRVSPAVEWYSGPFSAAAEFALDRHELATGESVSNTGWRLSAGYVLTGENSSRRGVTPASPFNWGKGTWGAFEIVARVSGLEVDDKLFDLGVLNPAASASEAISYGVGLNWFLNANVQARFDVEKTNLTDGPLADDELYAFTRLQFQF